VHCRITGEADDVAPARHLKVRRCPVRHHELHRRAGGKKIGRHDELVGPRCLRRRGPEVRA
jgi:hypothetical protein